MHCSGNRRHVGDSVSLPYGWAVFLCGCILGSDGDLDGEYRGVLAIGAITGWAAQHQCESHWMVVAIRIGVLGGLTTFSSFGIDVVKVWQAGNPVWAVGLVLLHVGLGLAAVVVGWKWTVDNHTEEYEGTSERLVMFTHKERPCWLLNRFSRPAAARVNASSGSGWHFDQR